ncbi:MAG: PKD domain-containing protein [Methanosarcinales archaeon]|nr:PKD domain-containing protein [Methanosarcinales archaeon]
MVKMLRQRRNYVITLACISLLLLGGCASALPDAKAGNDQHVSSGTMVTLGGSDSTGGDNLTYRWTEGSIVLSEGTAASFSYVFSSGTHTITLNVTDATGFDTDTVVVRVNQPLVANAGSDQVVSPGTTVRLDASGSFGSSISYVWKEDGTNISTKKSFSKTYSAGRHEVTLTVTDSLGNQDDDTAFVVVNRAPVADAGPDRTVTEETSVHFDGSNSSDPDGDSISYRWKEDGGAVLNAAPSFDMPLSCGAHRIMLEVTDVYGAVSAPDYVVIDVLPVYQEPPVAEAGADQTVLVGTNVTLDASGSYDSDGTIAKYEWREADANATLCESVSFERQFPRGVHNIMLTVTDSSGASATDEVVVMVRTSMDMPVADAGMDERVTLEGSEVLLDASGSSGENLTYRWIENGTLLSEEPVFSHLFDQGTRTVTLVVTDYYGSTDSAEIIVTTVTRGAAGGVHTAPDTRTGGKLSQYAAALVLLLAIAGIAIVFMRRKSSQQEPSYGSITGSIGGQKSGKDPEKQKSSKKEPKKQSKKQSKKDSRKQSDKHPPSKPKSESKSKSKSKSKTAVGDTKIADKPGIKAVVPEPDLDLSVKVLDESTKVPIPGVIIHLGPKTLKTGDNGVATFTVGSGEQTIDVHGIPNLYDSATTSVSVSADSGTVTLLLSSVVRPDHEQDTRLRSIRQAFENRYREVSGYDRCIPGFYRSMVQRQIEYVRGMTADHFIRGKHTPKEVTNRLISIIEVVSARISETMVSKRNIDLYATGASGAGSTSVCAASQIGHDLLANLLSDLPGFISSEYPGVQQILTEIDNEITSKSKNMSVLPVTGIWTIAKDLISDRSGDDLDRALRVLIAKVLLKHAREMYENPEIVKRMESGVL